MAADLSSWLHTGALIGVALLAGGAAYLLEATILAGLRRSSAKTERHWDDALVRLLDPPLPLAAGLVVFGAALQAGAVWAVPEAERWARALAYAGWVFVAAFAVARLLAALGERHVKKRPEHGALVRLLRRAGLGLIYGVALLVFLDSLGVQVTPVLASLGIGGIAIALALQDSLSNFFAGLWMRTSRDLRPGHFIRIEDPGLEGHVVSMGWRTTRLRSRTKNLIMVPNSMLARSPVTNYHLPEPRCLLRIVVSVDFGADAAWIGQVLLEAAAGAAGQVQGLLAEPAPTVQLSIGTKGLHCTLQCHAVDVSLRAAAEDAILRRALPELRAAGVRLAEP